MKDECGKVVVIGARAYPEIAGLIEDINKVQKTINVTAILDDDESIQGNEVMGVPVVGGLEKARTYSDDVKFIFAIGNADNRLARRDIVCRIGIPAERYISVLHPSVKVYSTAKLGYGCIIMPNVIINHKSVLGNLCVISASVTIACRCLLGEGVLSGPNTVVLESSKIGPYAYIGAGSVISEYGDIGPGSFVGVGSVVLKPVATGHFIMGNPPVGQIPSLSVPENIIEEWEQQKSDLSKMFHTKNKTFKF